MPEPKIERRTIHFSGSVQGVGFRYSTVAAAQGIAVQGFVQNLPDGRVLVVAEGTAGELNRFLATLKSRMESNIHDVKTDIGAPSGEFNQFDIRY